MNNLPGDMRREITKVSSERIGLRLKRDGYDEEQILALVRDDLLHTLARHILYQPAKREEEVRFAECGVARAEETLVEDRDVKMMELRIRDNWQTRRKKESFGDRKRNQKWSCGDTRRNEIIDLKSIS